MEFIYRYMIVIWEALIVGAVTSNVGILIDTIFFKQICHAFCTLEMYYNMCCACPVYIYHSGRNGI